MKAPAQRQVIAHELLGASEISAALGMNPYKAPLTLWLEKTGQLPRFDGNEATTWGLDVEPALRAWFVREYHVPVWVPPESLVSAEHPWMRGTPDGLVLRDAYAAPGDPANWVSGFEAKNTNWRAAHRWGEPGTDEVPTEHLLQAQQNMLVCGLDSWHLVASIGGAAPVVYEITRDEEIAAMIVEGGRAFMGHVEAGTPPPIDGSDAWAEYVRTKYPWTEDSLIRARPEDEVLVAEWKAAAAEMARLERVEAELKNQLAVVIGSAAGMESSLGRIHYKPRRGGPNYKGAFDELAAAAGLSGDSRTAHLEAHQRQDSRPLVKPRAWSNDR